MMTARTQLLKGDDDTDLGKNKQILLRSGESHTAFTSILITAWGGEPITSEEFMGWGQGLG